MRVGNSLLGIVRVGKQAIIVSRVWNIQRKSAGNRKGKTLAVETGAGING